MWPGEVENSLHGYIPPNLPIRDQLPCQPIAFTFERPAQKDMARSRKSVLNQQNKEGLHFFKKIEELFQSPEPLT